MCEIDHNHNRTLPHFQACLPCMIPSSDYWRDIQNLWLLTALEATSTGSSPSSAPPDSSAPSGAWLALLFYVGVCCAVPPARLIYFYLSHLPLELWILNFGWCSVVGALWILNFRCCCVVGALWILNFGCCCVVGAVALYSWTLDLELWMLFCCRRSAPVCIERTFCACQPPPFWWAPHSYNMCPNYSNIALCISACCSMARLAASELTEISRGHLKLKHHTSPLISLSSWSIMY